MLKYERAEEILTLLKEKGHMTVAELCELLYTSESSIRRDLIRLEEKGLLINIIPNIIEPLITQAVVDQTIIPEIYLRLSCAAAYLKKGLKEDAISQLDKALSLALPDKLYGILAEYVRHFDGLLEDRLKLQDELATKEVLKLYEEYKIGWTKLSTSIKNKYLIKDLTEEEHTVAKLVAFGLSNDDIANIQNKQVQEIKEIILNIMKKTNIFDIKEFVYFL